MWRPVHLLPQHTQYRFGLVCALIGAVLFSAKAIIVKLAYRYAVDTETLLALRMALALPFFVGLLWWGARRPTKAAAYRSPGKREIGKIIGVGLLGYYAASYLDFLGLQYISAALERLILFLYPTMVLLFGFWWFGKSISRRQWWAVWLSYSGIVLVFLHDVKLAGAQVVLGSLLVFASALSYALYLVFCGELVQRYGSLRLTVWATTVAALACILQFFVIKNFSGVWVALDLPWQVYALSLVNAICCTVLPVSLTMLAIEYCGAGVTSQAGMIGPVATIVLGSSILGEPVTLWQISGAAIVLGGIYLLSRPKT